MCGIAGALGTIDPSIHAAVVRMSDALRHRGPDAAGIWCDSEQERRNGAILAHRRLKILDLSENANQPMVDPATGHVVAFNGEIYNFRALRDELAPHGPPFATESDTEVLLRAFSRWGAATPQRLRGMFAVAVWDPRTRELLLVRDRFGMKPLYTCLVARPDGTRTLLFASEVRALMASGAVPPRLNPSAVASYVWNGFVTGPGTIVSGVRCLPAASVTTIPLDRLEPRTERYWSLGLPRRDGITAADLPSLLEDTVRLHLQSDVPLGVFLSGGIDSSAIASLASHVAAGRVHTFHISFDEAAYDESRFAREVAERLGTLHTDVRLTAERFRRDLEVALASIDQPTFDHVNSYFVSRAVREAGMTVALAGTGGDELFGGYRSFREVPRLASLSRWLGWSATGRRGGLAGLAMRALAGRNGRVPPQTRTGKLVDVLAARGRLPELYQVKYALFTADFQRDLLGDPDVSSGYGLAADRLDEMREMIRGCSARQAVSALEFTMFLQERLLRDTDAASMASSLEVRLPLVDHEVYEAVARLPEEERFTAQSKRALRQAAMPDLPAGLFERPKAGFVLPIEAWCRSELAGEVEQTLLDAAACSDVGLDPQAVARLWRSFQAGAPGLYWSRIWSIFVLVWWGRRHGLAIGS